MIKWFAAIVFLLIIACNKGPAPNGGSGVVPVPTTFSFTDLRVNGAFNGYTYNNVNFQPVIRLSFSAPVKKETVAANIMMKENGGSNVSFNSSYQNGDSVVVIQPSVPLKPITRYDLSIGTGLQSQKDASLLSSISFSLTTQIDSTDKFARITDAQLLDLVQRQTFKYFWELGHPVSGLARERNTSGETVTTGGTGFGVMSILAAINRNFITRDEGLARITKIVNFYKNNCTNHHGAFAHWINGTTGATIPFSQKDNGADLVETSFLMQGLLCARQYFNNNTPAEIAVRDAINQLWDNVDWNWFRQNNQNVLYWHYSPTYNWDMNMPIRGWNEALVVYVLGASSNTHAIGKMTYDNGWANNGAMKNGNTYYGINLPLGPAFGGPLFFAHYSFLGINPHDLTDAYANYWTQNVNHTLINYNYCKANPNNYYGYSNMSWGLTASDDNATGYSAHSPTNDIGVISPTAAISSMPYTPTESLDALRFFYYKLGDKIWGEYGFTDAFNLNNPWFANSYLAIDQGPQIVLIENYRSGLLWNLFMSCPEVKRGMKALGFQSPNL